MAAAGEGDQKQPRDAEAEEEGGFSPWDCGSPLYDSFEVASLCHVLDRHLMFLPAVSGGRYAGSDDDDAAPAAAALVAAAHGETVAAKHREGRPMRRHERALKATLRGIRSAVAAVWRRR